MNTKNNQTTVEVNGTTLAKRVLNSNLSDEDKIDIIQLFGKQSNNTNIISIPSVWTPQPLNPTYRERPEFVITCSTGNDTYLDDEK
jgi:hypothetical protein